MTENMKTKIGPDIPSQGEFRADLLGIPSSIQKTRIASFPGPPGAIKTPKMACF